MNSFVTEFLSQPQYTTESIDWKRETATLAKNGVKIYGVYCGARAQGFRCALMRLTYFPIRTLFLKAISQRGAC